MDAMYINELSLERRELLELLISESGSEFNCFPLSFAQQSLWFTEQLNPNTSTYNIFAAVQLTGSIYVAVLEQSVQEIVNRHEALRTNFIVIKDRPMQIVTTERSVSVPLVDLQGLSKSEQEAEVKRLAIAESQKPFDLTSDPLLRITLLQLNQTEHVLLLTMHHIISDGWSLDVFVRELATLYGSFLTGKSSPLPPLPIQYPDFASWQRQWLQGKVLQEQLAYWQQQLQGELPVLELPTAHQRPTLQSFRGARHPVTIPPCLIERLKRLGYQEDSTLFMTLFSAFQVLLFRYTSQDDILVGTPIANRLQLETAPLIGCFVNMLVFRTDLAGNPSFRELLRRVRHVALGAYAHQELPFEKLVEEIATERNLSHHPLFQVMFVLQNAPMPTFELPELTLRLLDIGNDTAKFDLTLELSETAEGLIGWFEYNTDIFESETIARMSNHFQTLLEGIVAKPDCQLSDLPLLSNAEQHQLLVEWNNTQTDYPKNKFIHQLFEEQASRTPDAVAVVFAKERLTYRQLDRQANQLAHYLRAHGTNANTLIGLCLPRSLDMVVGLLAILKAGGAYVAIDPTYPDERRIYMMTDSGIGFLLTHSSILANFNSFPEAVATVCLDDPTWIKKVAEKPNTKLPPTDLTSDRQLMYAIYTSGSTGCPKAAQVYHRGAVNLLHWYSGRVPTTVPDCVLLISSLSFDLTQKNIWSPLILGGTLVLMDDEYYDTDRIIETINYAQVTRINCAPSAFYPLAERPHLWPLLSSLKQVYLGGESIVMTRLQAWHEQSECELINSYGPTECTDVVSFHIVQLGELNPPIGKPIDNTKLYVLDKNQSLTPLGCVGELCVGGDGVGAGYLGRADLTAEKFIAHSFKAERQERLYRTGDLSRYLPDGTIEYLGRIDNQVEIRGFRIELGEIEVSLSQHPSVKHAIVTIRKDTLGNKRLVAYLVGDTEQTPSISNLRQFLKEKLPEYMVPAAFVYLDALPLTPNGKVDRKSLPTLDLTEQLAVSYVAPRTPTEEILANIWTDVVGIEQVGIHDNFFEIGGHSLLATQLGSRIRSAFEIELDLRSLFESATVVELAELIEEKLLEKIEKLSE
jgi:amino acid adenylation domain-containing protein